MKFKFDITDIDLTNLDAKTLNRDVDISQHLPQNIIGKGTEFQEIRKVENIELSNLWQNINFVLYDMFIHLANERGISYYEKILDINPEGSLEDRRQKVYNLWNRRIIWTHRSLEEWLNGFIGKENYKIEFIYDEYIVEFVIFMDKINEFKKGWIEKELRRIIPANLDFSWTLQFVNFVTYALYSVIDREKIMYQRLQSEFEKEHKYYQGMANILSEKEITFSFPSVYFIKDDGINVSGAYYLSKERVMWK